MTGLFRPGGPGSRKSGPGPPAQKRRFLHITPNTLGHIFGPEPPGAVLGPFRGGQKCFQIGFVAECFSRARLPAPRAPRPLPENRRKRLPEARGRKSSVFNKDLYKEPSVSGQVSRIGFSGPRPLSEKWHFENAHLWPTHVATVWVSNQIVGRTEFVYDSVCHKMSRSWCPSSSSSVFWRLRPEILQKLIRNYIKNQRFVDKAPRSAIHQWRRTWTRKLQKVLIHVEKTKLINPNTIFWRLMLGVRKCRTKCGHHGGAKTWTTSFSVPRKCARIRGEFGPTFLYPQFGVHPPGCSM